MCTARPPDGSAPAAVLVDVSPSKNAPASSSSSQPWVARALTTGACEGGFVEVVDGRTNAIVARYRLGRELVENTRGAKHAFAEEVIHQNGHVVFHLEAIANPDSYGGHVNVSVADFVEPTQLPAIFDAARAEYMPPGRSRESDERHQTVRVEITKWSDVGGWIEGTFTPSSPGSYKGQFRVCRTADWRVRI